MRRLHSIKIDNGTSIIDASKMVSKVLDEMPHEEIIRRSAISIYKERVNTINEVEKLRNEFAKKIDEKAKTNFSTPISLSLLYLDIDSFTSLNKRYGISVGNEVVITVQNILKKYCDKNLHTRWGGDSFLACFEDSLNEVLKIAESIRFEIYSFEWETIVPRLYATASFGVVEMDDFDNSRSLIERAKEGARLAKKQGGNKVMKGPLSMGPIMQKKVYESWDDMDS